MSRTFLNFRVWLAAMAFLEQSFVFVQKLFGRNALERRRNYVSYGCCGENHEICTRHISLVVYKEEPLINRFESLGFREGWYKHPRVWGLGLGIATLHDSRLPSFLYVLSGCPACCISTVPRCFVFGIWAA